MISNILSSYGSLTSIRVLSRVAQFLLKTYLIRELLDLNTLGHMVNLDLVLTTSLSFLKTCLKPSYQKVQHLSYAFSSAFNIMTAGILITTIVSGLVCFSQIYYMGSSSSLGTYQQHSLFTQAIICYGIAAIFQAVAQKYNTVHVLEYKYSKIALIEMMSFIPKTIFIFISGQTGLFISMGILVFGFGQLIYSSLFMVISFIFHPNKSLFFIPISLSQDEYIYIDPKSKASLKQFSILSIMKLILQELQKIVLVILDTPIISSVYTLVSNFGSIIVRYLFQPLEEVAYNYFSRGNSQQSFSTLVTIIKLMLVFSCLSISYGFNYSANVLMFIYGQKWTNQQSIAALQAYTVLLSVLGVNGILEAYTFARQETAIKQYRFYSIISTMIFILMISLMIHAGFGAAGFFYGNSISMIFRITVSCKIGICPYINFKEFIQKIVPSFQFLIFTLILFCLCRSQYLKFQSNNLLTLMVGCLIFLINLIPIILQNKSQIGRKIIQKKQKLL